MIKMMFLVKRKDALSADDFQTYWRETHAAIAAKMPGLRKYTLHKLTPWPEGGEQRFDGIAELWWDDESAMQAAFKSSESKAAYLDAKTFIDMDKQLDFSVEQIEVV